MCMGRLVNHSIVNIGHFAAGATYKSSKNNPLLAENLLALWEIKPGDGNESKPSRLYENELKSSQKSENRKRHFMLVLVDSFDGKFD